MIILLGACGVRLGREAAFHKGGFVIPSNAYGYSEYGSVRKSAFRHGEIHLSPWFSACLLWSLSLLCIAVTLRTLQQVVRWRNNPQFLTLSDTSITLPKYMWHSEEVTVEFARIRGVESADMGAEGGTGVVLVYYQPHGTTKISEVELPPAWLPPGAMLVVLSAIESHAPEASMSIASEWRSGHQVRSIGYL